MEDVRAFLQENHIDIDGSDSDSDISGTYAGNESLDFDIAARAQSPDHKANADSRKAKRQPTRRPDPNVYNRNALMARENRRKKKMHLVTIESELEKERGNNMVLMKALKKQMKTIRRLEKERQYYKNILANRPEIHSLISGLNSYLTQQPLASYSPSSLSSEQSVFSSNFDSSDNGSVNTIRNCVNPTTTTTTTETNFHDAFFPDLDTKTDVDDIWNQLLKEDDFGFKECMSLSTTTPTTTATEPTAPPSSLMHNVCDEHSYVNLQDTLTPPEFDTLSEDSGICLHISRGNISLEYCADCHWKACENLPKQLLQDTIA